MPTREQIIEQYGGLEHVPEYLRRGFEAQDRAQERREQAQRDHEAEVEAERERVKALRRPPRHVHLVAVGALTKVRWSPPETAGELEPAGYWVSEERNGEWTKHGDYLLPEARESALYGSGPAYVETWYHGMALGEMYRSPIVSNAPPMQQKQIATDPEPTRMERIVAAVRTFTGRRTRRGAPYVRALREHAGMPDITVAERNEAHRRAVA